MAGTANVDCIRLRGRPILIRPSQSFANRFLRCSFCLSLRSFVDVPSPLSRVRAVSRLTTPSSSASLRPRFFACGMYDDGVGAPDAVALSSSAGVPAVDILLILQELVEARQWRQYVALETWMSICMQAFVNNNDWNEYSVTSD